MADRRSRLRLYLINPLNPLVNLANVQRCRWNRYRLWKPLGLMVLAGLTPPDWDITIIDENVETRHYADLPRPDLVGITAFTSQAHRAYELAAEFRDRGVPVVMGGIHATMCTDEAMQHVDCVVTGEAEGIWASVLDDARHGRLQETYAGGHVDMADVPAARHDLLSNDYAFGAIQTTRGCPLDCSFCSVSAFNGRRYRHRPVDHVIQELQTIKEKWVLMVDDNLIGTSRAHAERAKDLFRAMIRARLRKKWIAQVTINIADDEELLHLAAKAGCQGVFIGFESTSPEGLNEVGKKFNLLRARDFRRSVRRIHRHNILVVGSFIMGLDTDAPGIGTRIADTARRYGVDILNTLFLTPLPGTRLWNQMQADGRIAADNFPKDWQYYTLGFPTARYRQFSWTDLLEEMKSCERRFYWLPRVLCRVAANFLRRRRPLLSIISNFAYRSNAWLNHESYDAISLPAEQGGHGRRLMESIYAALTPAAAARS